MGLVLSLLGIYEVLKFGVDHTSTLSDGTIVDYIGNPSLAFISIMSICILYAIYIVAPPNLYFITNRI